MRLSFRSNMLSSRKERKKLQRLFVILLTSGSLAGCAGIDKPPTAGSTYGKEQNTLEVKSNSPDPKSQRQIREYTDLWQRVRDNFGPEVNQNNPRIDYYVRWFSRHPKYFEKLMERSRPYLYYIVQQTNKRHMPSEFALVPFVESAFDPFAFSNGLASGALASHTINQEDIMRSNKTGGLMDAETL